MAADETRPAGINNEPGVATAECAEPTVDTSHTADQTLQCCSQLLLQITGETPYSHYPESENTHCSTLLQRERVESTLGIVIQETIGIWAEMWGGCFILFPWPNWVPSADDICPIYWPVLRSLFTVTSSLSLISLIISPLLLSSTCHSESMQLQNWVTRWQKVINQSKPQPQF